MHAVKNKNSVLKEEFASSLHLTVKENKNIVFYVNERNVDDEFIEEVNEFLNFGELKAYSE